jgi:hypothetical protein
MTKAQRRGVSTLIETTEELLVKAAVFLAEDEGSPGFLDRFTEAVNGDAALLSQALDRALTAQALAGHVSVRLEPGDLQVETTSAGASLTACAMAAPDGRVTAAVRLTDTRHRPVEGAAVQVSAQDENRTVVTNTAGWVHVDAAGPSLQIRVGQGQATGRGANSPDDATGVVIQLPRLKRGDELELAAAHDSDVAEADESGRWRVLAGGVEFLCLERRGGYDLTVLVAGVTAEFARMAVGTYGASFRTHDRADWSRRWLVPLAPSPLGLAGSLYGTDEDQIDVSSVEVGSTEQLMAALGGQLDEVIRRSVRHCDTMSVWAAVRKRLPPGQARTVLEAALAEREDSQ